MQRAVFPIVALALGVTSLLSAAHLATRPPETSTPVAASAPARHNDVSSGAIARALAVVSPLANLGDDNHASVVRRVRDGEAGTYIGDILRERDSSLARWPDRHGVPLTVWVQPRSPVQDFGAEYVEAVRSAFQEWGSIHLPIRFSFVDDSADAEVHVNWIDHFNEAISGRTRWARDDDWVITDANIILAIHHNQGEQLDGDAMRAMAMHEIGHLLGLDHTTDSLSIMAPKVRVRQLSDADRATARLIYALPTGPLGSH